MVNPENLRLVRVTRQLLVECLRRLEIVAERFLYDEPLPTGTIFFQETGFVNLLDDFAKLARRNREVKQQVLAQCGIAE